MKEKLINLLLFLVATTVMVVLSEYLLRVNQYSPEVSVACHPNEPIMQAYNPILGWNNKPGCYNFSSYSAEEKDSIQISFHANGFRRTSLTTRTATSNLAKILFVGGSFVQGLAISDSATMAWKVQQAFPEMEVINAGVPAYGTYQSLLLLEQKLPQLSNVKTVFYGLLHHHTKRNIATSFWTEMLTASTRLDSVSIPYVSLKKGKLVRYAPQAYRRIPYAADYALVKLLERGIFNYKTNLSIADQNRILILLLEEMKELVAAQGAELVVIGFNLKDDCLKQLEQNEFTVIDCQWDTTDLSYAVPGEGHPSGKANSEWAEQVDAYLNEIYFYE